MMKKLIVLGIVSMMVMGMSVASHAAVAADAQWQIQLLAVDQGGLNGVGVAKFGTLTTASDGKGSEDSEASGTNTVQAELVAVDLPAANTANPPRYVKDQRAPVGANTIKTWNLLLFGGPSYAGTSIILKGWQPAKDGLTDVALDSSGFSTLGLFYNGQQIWDLKKLGGANGSSTAPQFTYAFNPEQGRSGAYQLQLVAATVPEPGSIVAMLSGLVGLVGYGIRRRK